MKRARIISAPCILGLVPGGVEKLGQVLIEQGIGSAIDAAQSVIHVDPLNEQYSYAREQDGCLNSHAIRSFSMNLAEQVEDVITQDLLPLVLGGDCSIVIGAMASLKKNGRYGLIFLDAHADFYEAHQSPTGQVADMDLAIVTGRGPEELNNIFNLRPYVKETDVIHIGQRDQEEAEKYGCTDIRETSMKCFSLAVTEANDIEETVTAVSEHMKELDLKGWWIHFDTDVLNDDLNPAVDYRIPGGLLDADVKHILKSLLLNEDIVGISISIYNPDLDSNNQAAFLIIDILRSAFARDFSELDG